MAEAADRRAGLGARVQVRSELALEDGEAAAALYELTQEMTDSAGLPAYEISNHATPGEESRHNLLYWRYGEYVGVGPGAHGRIVVDGVRQATSAERKPEQWAALVETRGHGLVEATTLTRGEEADEALLMGLRLAEGIDLDHLAAIGGAAPRQRQVERLVELGLLHRPNPGRIAATRAGRVVLNEVAARLAAALEPVPNAIGS